MSGGKARRHVVPPCDRAAVLDCLKEHVRPLGKEAGQGTAWEIRIGAWGLNV